MSNQFNSLLLKLDEFTRKYYKNQLLRGSLIFVAVLLSAYLTCIFTDFLANLSPSGRTVLFFSFLTLFAITLFGFILHPAFKIFRMGKIISHKEAARIIGNHFPQVNDKIINTLQLSENPYVSGTQNELITASIDQKIVELRPVPFVNAVDLSANKKYLRYALPPLGILLALLMVKPSVVTESTNRIVNYDKEFLPVAPFQFNIQNKDLTAAERSDFKLDLKLTGNSIPQEVFIHIGDITYKLNKESKTNFSYTFNNLSRNTDFYFSASGFNSKEYELKILPRPSLLDFSIQLEYPKYLGKQDQTLSKTGDLNVPEGTKITWNISTKNTEKLAFSLSDSLYALSPVGNMFLFKHRAHVSMPYAFMASNKQIKQIDSLGYFLNVIPDQYPEILVDETIDSVSQRSRYFMGTVNDDYGFTGLNFYFRHVNDSLRRINKLPEFTSSPVSFSKAGTSSRFTMYWGMEGLELAPGDQVEYFFTVWDNDGVNGPKSARSGMKVFRVPSLEEISQQTEKNNSEIKKEMENAIKEADKLKKEFENFQRDLTEHKNFDWQQQNKAEDLLKKQNDLQLKLEQIQKMNLQNNEQKSEFKEIDPELKEKQDLIDELFEKLMTDEMKKMLEELQKLMEQADKNAIQQQLEKMKAEDKDLSKELDRSLELFKQLELEQKIGDLTEKLDELEKEQRDLAEKSKEKNANTKDLEKKQDELNKKFEDVKKDLKEAQKLNSELEEPMKMENTDSDQKSIGDKMEESKQQLGDNKGKKASENQQNAADEMHDLSNKLQKMLDSAQEEQNELDMQALRQLLENIVQLSFDQEELMNQLGTTAAKDPKYVKLGQKQRKLKDDAMLVEDSLFALSKRVAQLKSYVNQEIEKVNENMSSAMKKIEERNTSLANRNQQLVMTSLNNLALLLDDALQSMQQKANTGNPDSKGNKSKCKKPGNKPGNKPGDKPSFGQGKPSIQGMKKMQEQLGKQLEQLKKQMEEGKIPGKNGKGSNGLIPGMSEDLAKTIAKQQAIRQALQQMGQQLNKDGSGNGKELQKIAEEMEKNEDDLVNQKINIETLKRQQDILTRLLESEKAEREREQDNKRESKENKLEDFSNQKEFLEYKRKKEKEVELLRTIPPSLTPYYKQKVNQYFNRVQ